MNSKFQQDVVYFLSPSSIHKTKLFNHLSRSEQLFNNRRLDIRPLDFNKMSAITPPLHRYFALVDANFSEKLLFKIQNHVFLTQAVAIALFNAPKRPNLLLISHWYHLAGYFYKFDDLIDITNGLKAILNGQTHLPHTLLVTLFQYWQNIHFQSSSHVIERLSLTNRERDVLNQLQIGLSNLDIANNLSVSEHTIKSHLYRIFKKINVDNRRQAINWANLYL